MALTAADIDAVRALWSEWVTEPGFRLVIEVTSDAIGAHVHDGSDGAVHARIVAPSLHCNIEIWRLAGFGDEPGLIFAERIPHDAAMLRASVTVLAGAIAEYDRHDGEQV